MNRHMCALACVLTMPKLLGTDTHNTCRRWHMAGHKPMNLNYEKHFVIVHLADVPSQR